MIALSATAWAEVPKELKGTWVVDLVPSIQYMQTSPKWTDQTATHLPPILQRMSQAMYEFTDDYLVVSIGGKKKKLPVSLISTQSNVTVFERTVGGQLHTLTVSMMNGSNINVKSSFNHDLDFYLWKRGRVTTQVEPSVIAHALQLVLTSHENTVANPVAQWMSGKWGIGWRFSGGDNKYSNGYKVDHLIEQVKAIPGLSYVLFNLSNGADGSHYTAPHSVLSKVSPGSCARRDLFGEMATAFQAAGYQVLVYMATEGPAKLKHGPNHGRGPQSVHAWTSWVKAQYGSDDVETLKKAYAEVIVGEYAQRYGTLIDGWWFDHASFGNIDLIHKEITQANPKAAIAFNLSRKGAVNCNPDYEDYTYGHPTPLRRAPASSKSNLKMVTAIENSENGYHIVDGKPSLGHMFMPMKNRWNSGADVVWPEEQAVDWMQRVLQARGAWTWNVPFNDKTTELDLEAVDFAIRVGAQLR